LRAAVISPSPINGVLPLIPGSEMVILRVDVAGRTVASG
jgi:hypothetical protein